MTNQSFFLWTFIILFSFLSTNALLTFQVDGSRQVSRIPKHFLGNFKRSLKRIFKGFTNDWWVSDDPAFGDKWGNAGILTFKFLKKNKTLFFFLIFYF